MTKKTTHALISKIDTELKGRILQVTDYTFIRVESVSFTQLPETSYYYETFLRCLHIAGRMVSVHTYCGKHKADLTAYKSESIKLPTTMPVPEYDVQDLLSEITKTYPIVQNTDALKARVSEAQTLINTTIADFFNNPAETKDPTIHDR